MKFYRIENEKLEGPYRNSICSLITFLDRDHDFDCISYAKVCPTPQKESKKLSSIIDDNFIFGFNTPKKLIKWFSYANEADFFKKYKFKVSIYEATEVFSSKRQSVAIRTNLHLIEKINFKDFVDKNKKE